MLEGLIKLDIGDIKENEPMKNHTTMKVGGVADIFIRPRDEESLIRLINYLRKNDIEFLLIGQGANLLVSDKGIRGVVISLVDTLNNIEIDGTTITGGAGVSMKTLCWTAAENGLTGMEGIYGIPGTLGGLVTMNAGAYGTEMKDVIQSVKVLDHKGEIQYIENSQMNFTYRGSRIKDEDLIVLGAVFQLEKGDPEEIKGATKEIMNRRILKQPLNLPSAGSTFKRPTGHYAAALIEEAGLKGMIHRGMRVSDKHSGFVVNHKEGTFDDWYDLITLVRKEIKDKYNVDLELENLIVGDFSED